MPSNGTDLAATLEQDIKECENEKKSPADAQKVVDLLDQILDGKSDLPKKGRYLTSLMKICKAYRFVPTSHLILESKLEKLGEPLEDEPDVWPGSYGEDPVSIKVFSKYQTDDDEKIKRRLCREAVVWKRLSHQNILPFTGVTLSTELAIVYPGATNILEYLRDDHEANPVKLLEEAATGLKYLHDTRLVHGGLQARYIYIDDDGHARLGNAGHASIDRERGGSMLGGQSTGVGDGGHFRYIPPEFLTEEGGKKPATRESDIYSMGMTIYEVMTDEKPFKGYGHNVVMEIIKGERPKKPNFLITRGYTEELWKLTTDCWHPDHTKRPTVDKVLEVLHNEALKWKPRI